MKNTSQNHPKKGSSIKVEPIRDLKNIRTIKKLLADHPRNYCLFVLGITTAFRAGLHHKSHHQRLEIYETNVAEYS